MDIHSHTTYDDTSECSRWYPNREVHWIQIIGFGVTAVYFDEVNVYVSTEIPALTWTTSPLPPYTPSPGIEHVLARRVRTRKILSAVGVGRSLANSVGTVDRVRPLHHSESEPPGPSG
jgi:hypothetical protein